MTAARYIVIRCDANPDGCTAEASTPFAARNATEVRKHNEDWHRSKSGDICPQCWKDGYR
jgi:hypothetical protein